MEPPRKPKDADSSKRKQELLEAHKVCGGGGGRGAGGGREGLLEAHEMQSLCVRYQGGCGGKGFQGCSR